MAHKFKVNKSSKNIQIGQIEENKLNGLGVMYNCDTKGFVVGRFKDGTPSGVYFSEAIIETINKTKKCVCLSTDPTKKHLGCFQMFIFNDMIVIHIYDDGNKEAKQPYRIVIKENSWLISKKGSKKFDVVYALNNIDGKEYRFLHRPLSNKKIFPNKGKELKWVNLDPALINFTIPDFPFGVQFEDKRKTLKAKGIGPCFESKRHEIKLYFIANNKNEGLSWSEIGKEYAGTIDISQYKKGEFIGYVTIDKATNLLKIFIRDLHESVEMVIDPQSCSFEIMHIDYIGVGKKDKAKVDKDAKVTYWSNYDPDEDTFDFEETY